MTDIILRPYQTQFINDVRNEFALNHKRVVGVAPCGAGKTIMTGWMIKQALARNKRSIFFVHRHELIEQTSKTFTALDIPHGIINAGSDMQLDLPVQIASVQTLARRIEHVPAPDFLICDECHHILANTYKKILDAFPNAFLLGVTATPQRMGGITLNDVFDSMVNSLSVNQLIKLGNLTPFKYFAADCDIDLSDVHLEHGDYRKSELEKVMSDTRITGDIVDHYLYYAKGKSAICYCVNVKHSESVADAFNLAGISAAHCDGNTSKKLRASIINDFRNNNIKVLCNAELFGEGFDVPHCQAVILARPTKSLTLFIQQSMRAMRPDPDDPNKVAIILDCVQNRERHGLPNDFHKWSLDPNVKGVSCPRCEKKVIPIPFKHKKGTPIKSSFEKKFSNKILLFLKPDDDGNIIKISVYKIENEKTLEPIDIKVEEDEREGHIGKICPKCGYLFNPGLSVEDFQKPPIRQPNHRDGAIGELEVSFEDSQHLDTIIHKPTKPEQFLTIATKKRYSIGWVALQSLQFAQSYEDCLHIADICGYKKGWAWHKWNDISMWNDINNLKDLP